ncbi:hypothetical protein ACFZAC_18330, partial [Pseudomonas fluorescens]|uniref:hypothetical protein n=1 Tax=Pseudomonas fluorescens TaxID=294 RepID=UPI00374935FC
ITLMGSFHRLTSMGNPSTCSKLCRYHYRIGYIMLLRHRADGSLLMVGNAIRTLCSNCYANSD